MLMLVLVVLMSVSHSLPVADSSPRGLRRFSIHFLRHTASSSHCRHDTNVTALVFPSNRPGFLSGLTHRETRPSCGSRPTNLAASEPLSAMALSGPSLPRVHARRSRHPDVERAQPVKSMNGIGESAYCATYRFLRDLLSIL
jgi:hypothetical protein